VTTVFTIGHTDLSREAFFGFLERVFLGISRVLLPAYF